MIDGELPDEAGHADDIVPVSEYAASLPPRKDFLPWHRPRKQFVRHYQWFDQISRLLDEHALTDGILKYLGLPGVDLLDLRHFHAQICEPRNIGLRFLGFNSAATPASEAQAELNISLVEVRQLARVDHRSDVIADDFARVASGSSPAWKMAFDLGPFDVINLDLCDGFGAQAPSSLGDTHYNALNRMMSLQARQKTPWLLLLTTLAGPDHVHPEVLKLLLEKYIANLTTCDKFQKASTKALKIDDAASLMAAVKTPEGLLPVFLCGICKWLAGICVGQVPPSRIEVRSVVGYRVYEGAPMEDLISIAIRFTPTFEPGPDLAGLANNRAAGPDECSMAVQALDRITKRRNADQILAETPALRAEMIAATAALLELARYDSAAYSVWAGG